jgi:hypothetical protein
MRLLALPVLGCLLLCSCEINHYDAFSASTGNHVHEDNYQLAGTRSSKRSDGSSYSNDYQKSFADAMQAAPMIAGAIYAGKVNLAHENGATAKDLAAQQTAQKANAALIPLSKPIVTSPGQAVTIPPAPAIQR